MCVLSIELVWVEIYGKMREKPPFLGNLEVWYRYQKEWYRYHMCSSRLVPVLTLVDWYRYRKVGTGTQYSILDQC